MSSLEVFWWISWWPESGKWLRRKNLKNLGGDFSSPIFFGVFTGNSKQKFRSIWGSAVELGVPFFKDTGSNLSVVTIPPRQSPRSVMWFSGCLSTCGHSENYTTPWMIKITKLFGHRKSTVLSKSNFCNNMASSQHNGLITNVKNYVEMSNSCKFIRLALVNRLRT